MQHRRRSMSFWTLVVTSPPFVSMPTAVTPSQFRGFTHRSPDCERRSRLALTQKMANRGIRLESNRDFVGPSRLELIARAGQQFGARRPIGLMRSGSLVRVRIRHRIQASCRTVNFCNRERAIDRNNRRVRDL